jgi:hypothetical protein
MAKWMMIQPNMRWEEVKFERDEENNLKIKMVRNKKLYTGKIQEENDFTKVMRVILDNNEENMKKVHIVDFDEVDKYFEEAGVNFRNRRGLRKEIRRYMEFSLSSGDTDSKSE